MGTGMEYLEIFNFGLFLIIIILSVILFFNKHIK